MPKRRAETPAVSMSEMSLQEHLAAAEAHEAHRTKRQQELRPAPSTASPDPYIDPILRANLFDLDPSTPKGRKAIVSTKRAAQNRSAQQAFRQRKDGHIRELEDQVNHLKTFETSHRQLQAENNQLRNYIDILQLSLSEAKVTVPPPPPALDPRGDRRNGHLEVHTRSGEAEYRHNTAPMAAMTSASGRPLRSLLEETDEADDQPSSQQESKSGSAKTADGGRVNGEATTNNHDTLDSNIEPSLLAQSEP